MIQINLIPDIKRELLRAQSMRRSAISVSIIVGLVAGGIVVALAIYLGVLALHETITRGNIKSEYNQLTQVENIDNVLTIQQQLKMIDGQQTARTMDSRLFDILGAINPPAPNDVKFSSIKLDPNNNLITIEGSAVNGYSATETFRKTILNTKVESGSGDTAKSEPLTDDVTIAETTYGESADGSHVLRFSISFAYPKGLFDNSLKNIKIVTPTAKTDVTDSKTRVPESLFTQTTTTKEGN